MLINYLFSSCLPWVKAQHSVEFFYFFFFSVKAQPKNVLKPLQINHKFGLIFGHVFENALPLPAILGPSEVRLADSRYM